MCCKSGPTGDHQANCLNRFMKTVRFAIIGGGLMGREFASASARFAHLPGMDVRPEIVAICSPDRASLRLVHRPFPDDPPESRRPPAVLANPEVDAVYCAVPHHLHEPIYCAAIEAGKHLMGEKPFGIDRPANQAIVACAVRHPELLVRCASEFPYFPAVQRLGRDDRERGIRPDDRGERRVSALERPRPRTSP